MASYIGIAPPTQTGIVNRFQYTGDGSTTAYSGADNNGTTLAYTSTNPILVYLNGVQLYEGTDYTKTSNTTVTFASAPALNDAVEILTFGPFEINSPQTFRDNLGIELSSGEILYGNTSNETSKYALSGTSNEIEINTTSNTITLGLPNDVAIGNDLTVTEKLKINTTTQLGRLTISGSNDYDDGPVVWLHGDAINQSNSGTIRLTENNASMQGAWIQYNGAGNRLLLGTHATGDFTTGNDITHISMSRGSGFVGINIGDANPAYPLVVGNNEGIQDAAIEIKGIRPYLVYTDTGDSTYVTQQLNGANFTHNQSGNNQFQIVQDTSAQFYYNVIVDGDLTVDTDTLYVDSTNNRVGVGTTSPGYPLHIVGSADGSQLEALTLTNSAGTTSSEVAIRFINSTDIDNGPNATEISSIRNGTNDHDLVFSTSNGSVTERLRITSEGYVGIGTTSPSTTLDVSGTVTATTFSGSGASLTNIPNSALDNSSITVAGDSGSDGVSLGETLTIAGGTGLTSTGTSNTMTIALDNTAVTAGSYGSSTAIPTFTVDAQGRLTAASTASISSDMSIAGDSGTDTITIGTDTFTIAGGTGLTSTGSSNTITIALDNTAVTAGSYGSSTAIPTFTVDAQGRLTAASTTAISSDMSIAGDTGTDTITVGTDTFTIAGGTGLTSTATTDTITLNIDSTVATLTGTQTLTNKTISGSSNTLSNIGNSSLTNSDITFAGDSGSDGVNLGQTLTIAGGTNITTAATSNTITINLDSNVVTETSTDTLTNKTIALGSNTVSGTLAQFQTAVTDATLVDLDDVQTLTNKTINTASNTITITESDISDLQSYILADSTDTLTNKTISGSSNTLSNIGNASLTNSSITVTDGSTSTAVSLGGTITIQGTTNEIEVSESSGTVTIGLPSDTTIGNNLTIAGNLTVNGTTTTLNTTNTTITDNLLELNSGATSNANDSGILIERGTTGDNAIMAWDESADQFIFGTTTATASDTGNLTIAVGNINVGGITTTGITSTGNINLGDSDRLRLGASQNLQIYFDGTNSYIDDVGSGSLYIKSNTLLLTDTAGDNMLVGLENGEARLYHNGSEKLATKSTGIDVTGTVVSDGLTVDGDVAIASDNPTLTLTDNNNSSSRADIHYNFGYLTLDADANAVDAAEGIQLQIGGTTHFGLATGGDISFYEDTGTTPKFFWDASAERLGIGTTSPSSYLANKLVVATATSDDGITIANIGTNITNYLMFADGTTGLDRYRGAIGYNHNDNSLRLLSDGSEAMRIDSSGNVGIGTSSPQSELHVSSSANADIRLSNDTVGNGTNDGLTITMATNSVASINQRENAPLLFYTNNTEAMRIDSSGNVGIGGITSLTDKLHLRTATGSVGMRFNVDDAADFRIVNDGSNNLTFIYGASTERMRIDSSGHVLPGTTNTYDLGSTSLVWRNIYTSDFHMSNEGMEKGNDIDGTKGSWTFQEGENDLFLINNKNGKKYKFNLTEVK